MIKENKKAWDNLMGVLIFIIIALVFAVIVFFLIKNGFLQADKASGCEQAGGKCVKFSDCDGTISALKCEKEKVCCISAGG
jgi:hypothetical protein